ncbi:hypothetical protein A3F65_03070 [Candidatus Saccharibacteria bacterium RIFCSPHIGHO2_12_FULL_47_16b]|nr:MAG: hypothetical protein A3F65_03070 [Candidatus Saccharibacteria bacterium RIFCSPHIGHO2_12_FULL_47_16b]
MAGLRLYDDFKRVLADYKVSDRAKRALDGLKLVIMVAPTSTGRNTIIDKLHQKADHYYFIVSDTTRIPQVRDGKLEANGVQYSFRSEEDMLADLKAGEFLEAALIHDQQVSGISIRELEKAKHRDKIAITDVEIIGADNIMRAKPDTMAIFVVPPSFEEWQNRIRSRGHMNEQEFKNRLLSADKELVAAIEHDYYQFVIADDLERTVGMIDAIATGQSNQAENQKGRQLIKQIHQQLQVYLTGS